MNWLSCNKTHKKSFASEILVQGQSNFRKSGSPNEVHVAKKYRIQLKSVNAEASKI